MNKEQLYELFLDAGAQANSNKYSIVRKRDVLSVLKQFHDEAEAVNIYTNFVNTRRKALGLLVKKFKQYYSVTNSIQNVFNQIGGLTNMVPTVVGADYQANIEQINKALGAPDAVIYIPQNGDFFTPQEKISLERFGITIN